MKRRSVRQLSNLLWKLSTVLFVLLTISCGSSPSRQNVQVSLYSAETLESITLSGTAGPIEIGGTLQFSATATYSDGTTKSITADVTWSSSSPSVAQVSAAGLVTALSSGSTSISANLEGQSASSTVTVNPTLNSLAVSPATSSLQLGDTLGLTATGTYEDASSRDLTASASWTTSNPGIATVSESGVVTAVGAGLCSVTATFKGISNTASLRVWPSLSSIKVLPADPQIELQTSQQFTAWGVYSDGSQVDLTGVAQWNSDNVSVATISQTGLVSTTASGTSLVSATWQGIKGSSTLTVQPTHLVSLVIDQDGVTLPIDIPQQLTATGVFSDTATRVLPGVSWISSDPNVLSIDQNGVAWTHAEGSVTVSASDGSVVGTGTITVSSEELYELSIAPQSVSIPAGIQQQLTVVGAISDDTTRNLVSGITWESSNPSVASVDQDGRLNSFTLGATTIKATIGEFSAYALVQVTEATLVSMTIDPGSATSPAGTEQQFKALGIYSDGTPNYVSSVATWRSTDGAIATVSNSGLAKGIGPGTVSVVADIAGIEGAASFDVTPTVLMGITIVPSDVVAPQGNYIQYKATANYSGNSTKDVTSNVTWASTAPDVVSIDDHGLAIAHKVGTATINAVFEAQSALSNVTVAVAGSVTSEAAAPTITARGYFLTPTVTMSSSTPGVWIYYTTDGTTPTTASMLYTGPITISDPATVQAMAAGGTYTPSGITSLWVRVGAATPTISPGGGVYATPPTVTIASISPGVSIHYTLDGSTPTTSSPLYSGPFTLNTSATVRAIATGGNYDPSLVGQAVITISSVAPSISKGANAHLAAAQQKEVRSNPATVKAERR